MGGDTVYHKISSRELQRIIVDTAMWVAQDATQGKAFYQRYADQVIGSLENEFIGSREREDGT